MSVGFLYQPLFQFKDEKPFLVSWPMPPLGMALFLRPFGQGTLLQLGCPSPSKQTRAQQCKWTMSFGASANLKALAVHSA